MTPPFPPARPDPQTFAPEVWGLFDRYVHGLLSRRDFLKHASRFAVAAGLTAEGLLDALNPAFAANAQVAPDDARLELSLVEIPSPDGYGKARGYQAKPAGASAASPLPTVLVVHENRGLNPHIEDITRRLALDGFLAFAPDALFPLGGYPGDEDRARELFKKLDPDKSRADFLAAARWLKRRPDGNHKTGAVGFCWGGGMANWLATQMPDLNAAVPFYGTAPDLTDVPRIQAPLLLHFAANDERVDATWPPYEAALKAAGKRYRAFVYPGTQHGFNNDTTPRYDKAAATLAWERTVAFFNETLGARAAGVTDPA